MTDTYLTIKEQSTGTYSEKRSKFLAFAFPTDSVDKVKALVAQYEKAYYDARHVCYAYMLGHKREEFRAVDNGEPSGTAGKPILGQINSLGLTDVLVIVVRYFGGVKLGTGGLIVAYRRAAAEALGNAEIEERTIDSQLTVTFEYPLLNQVMRIVKEEAPVILKQDFQLQCVLHMKIRQSQAARLAERLSDVRGVEIERLY